MLASDPARILDQILDRAGIPLTQESTSDDHACLMTFPWISARMVHHRRAATRRW